MPHILLPTDLSDASLNAVRFAVTHFGGTRARFTLVHSYLDPRTDRSWIPDLSDMARKQAVKGLRNFERKCKQLPRTHEFARLASPVWLPDALNDLVHEQGADMVILGSQGTGMNTMFGSMAIEVTLKAEVPVIVVPSAWQPGPIKRVMLAHDSGGMEAAAVLPLLRLAKRKKAEVVVAHVRDNIIAMDGGMDRPTLKELLPGIPVSFVTAYGENVARTIDQLATAGRIQLVAVVHRTRGFWKGLIHGSKTKRIALHTHVPLLVLR